jgi:TetR/AcrR family hemagglutinin/protease transcriptional regulator
MKNPPRTRLSPEDRRAQLLQHALASFADHGIARATHAHVAARAGVSVSAVYSYFRTRADLVAAVLHAVEATIETMVQSALTTPHPAPEALTILAGKTAEMALQEPHTVRIWLDWSTGVSAEAWPQFLLMQARLHALIETVITRSPGALPTNPPAAIKAAARIFVGSAHTLALMQFEAVPKVELDAFIAQMVSGVLR